MEELPARIKADARTYSDVLRTTDALYNMALQELRKMMDSSKKTNADNFSDGSGLLEIARQTQLAARVDVKELLESTDRSTRLLHDRAPLMAERLAQLGVPLDGHWFELLPDLRVRVAHVLEEINCRRLDEVLLLLRNDGQALMKCKNFGRKSLGDLWQALEALATGEESWQPGLFRDPSPSIKLPPALLNRLSVAEALMERLTAKGIELEQPWQQELPSLPVRLRTVLEGNFVTLREVVVAATDGSEKLIRLKNLGRTSLEQLRQALESLAEHGRGSLCYGEGGAPPATVGELLTQALATLAHDQSRLLIRRRLDGATLQQLGGEYGVTRERIRQKVNKTQEKLARRFGAAARELTSELSERGDQAGGLLHRDMVQALTGESDLARVVLALLLASTESARVWRGDFLTSLNNEELRLRLDAIRQGLIENRLRDLTLPLVREIVRQTGGFDLELAGLACLLTTHFACQVGDDGAVQFGFLLAHDRVAKILRAAGRPMHISEVADAWLAVCAAGADDALRGLRDEQDDELEDERSTSPESPDPPDSASRRETIERYLGGVLQRHDDIYRCDPQTFVPSNALPVPCEQLDELAQWCVIQIEGETGAISAEYLLKLLDAAGLSAPGVNKYLLKDALARRPEIISLKKFRVGHIASFQEHGQTMATRLEAILSASERPLSSAEIFDRLPRHIGYSLHRIGLCLAKAPFAVNLGGRYHHVESLGLGKQERERLIEAAVAHLPEDGSPVSCCLIWQKLRAEMPEPEWVNRYAAPDLLRGLLRLSEQVQCGTGYWVARRTGNRTQPLLREVVAQVISNLTLAGLRDIRRELNNSHGERLSSSMVSSCLIEGVRLGVFRRLPASLYCLSDADDEKLMLALASHDDALRGALDEVELAELPAANAWLLARYFYRQADLAMTERMLRLLLDRADLSDGQRRNAQRLRALVLSKM